MQMSVARTIASTLQAYRNCQTRPCTTGNGGSMTWADKHKQRIEQLCRDLLPSGSGIDSGTRLDMDTSKPDRLVFNTAFHHMDDNGMYNGWTEHTVTVKASLIHDLDIRVGGRNRNDIKDYLGDTFEHALSRIVDWSAADERYREVPTT